MSGKSCVLNILASMHSTRRYPSFHRSITALPALAVLLFAFIFVVCSCDSESVVTTDSEVWVGTWSTAPQLVAPGNMPPNPGLSNNTLRQIVCVSLGGTVCVCDSLMNSVRVL